MAATVEIREQLPDRDWTPIGPGFKDLDDAVLYRVNMTKVEGAKYQFWDPAKKEELFPREA